MNLLHLLGVACALGPMAAMLAAAGLPRRHTAMPIALRWHFFLSLCGVALGCIAGGLAVALAVGAGRVPMPPGLILTPLSLAMALLVQLLGTVIGRFSARYLHGEPGQPRYVAALAGALAAVHLLLLADHWLVLIVAWAASGWALQQLLCFYRDRAAARLAAHKKRIADRAADLLLIATAALAWSETGSGSLSALATHIAQHGSGPAFQIAAITLVLAVSLRTALLPVHGWLIQVMEAPTPVSALLHAGLLNLGGFVLIRCAPLLEAAPVARALLVLLGLASAVLAGMVMLTRISIKVRLAWSTVAQMGFMLLECGLGLYTLAALHLFGHSLYKAHAFLSASTVVRDVRLQMLRGTAVPLAASVVAAPLVAIATVLMVPALIDTTPWPWWWSAALGLAWAPLFWLPQTDAGLATRGRQLASGWLMVAGLTVLAVAVHRLPLGTVDQPHDRLGLLALAGLAALYLSLAVLKLRPQALQGWRRWSYAGFYVDEAYTRLALQLWPGHWAPTTSRRSALPVPVAVTATERPR